MSKIGVYRATPLTLSDGGQTTDVQVDSSGFQKISLGSLIAGERNPDSATNSYQVVRPESNASILAATGALTIGAGAAGDTHLFGIRIHTALVGTLTITGFADTAGAATSYVFPATTVAGFYDFSGAVNSAGALTMTLSSATDYTTNKSVMVFWRPV